MTLRTLALATSAALALVAPVGTALGSTGHHATTHHPVLPLHPAPKVYTAPFSSTPIVTPRYVYVPAAIPNPYALAYAEDCSVSGNNCTPEQLCEIWGEC